VSSRSEDPRSSIHSVCSASSSQPRATSSNALFMDGLLVCAARFLASAALCRYSSDRDDMQGEHWKDASVPQIHRTTRQVRRWSDGHDAPRQCVVTSPGPSFCLAAGRALKGMRRGPNHAPYCCWYPHLLTGPTAQQPVCKQASYRLWQTGCVPQCDRACEQVSRSWADASLSEIAISGAMSMATRIVPKTKCAMTSFPQRMSHL